MHKKPASRASSGCNSWQRNGHVENANCYDTAMAINFAGSWKADLSRSKFLAAPPTALTAQIEHSDPELQLDMLVTKADGSEDRVVLECRTDGEEGKSLLNGRAIRGNAGWRGEELMIESWVQFGTGEMHFCDSWSLSPDGQRLTMEHRDGDLKGQIVVLERAA
jgi:hypothetical protein